MNSLYHIIDLIFNQVMSGFNVIVFGKLSRANIGFADNSELNFKKLL